MERNLKIEINCIIEPAIKRSNGAIDLEAINYDIEKIIFWGGDTFTLVKSTELDALLQIFAKTNMACRLCIHGQISMPCTLADPDWMSCETSCICKACHYGSNFAWKGRK